MTNETDQFLTSVDATKKRAGVAISDEVMLETRDVNVYVEENPANMS